MDDESARRARIRSIRLLDYTAPCCLSTDNAIVTEQHPRLDSLFEQARDLLGQDFDAYRNHCYRVFNYAVLMADPDEQTLHKLAIAIYFHDIGIWTDHTFDYLEPSARRARDYLAGEGLEDWSEEITAMITEHHKVGMTCGQGPLVELFRRADWIDVSLGLLRFGIPRQTLREISTAFPNEGFHKRLVSFTLRQLRRSPLRPLPMFKW